MVTIGETYVERVEKALVETAVLSELRRQGDLTQEQLVSRVMALGGWDDKVDDDFIEGCIDRLEGEHIEENGERFTLLDDGREDLMKIEGVVKSLHAHLSTSVPKGSVGSTPRGGF